MVVDVWYRRLCQDVVVDVSMMSSSVRWLRVTVVVVVCRVHVVGDGVRKCGMCAVEA